MLRIVLVAASLIAAPALAQVATPATTVATPAAQSAASSFINKLSNDAFALLRDKKLSRDAARTQFRAMLRQNFAIDEIGARLIRRFRAQLTPQQLSAYQAALPLFIVNTYADRLYDFSDAKVTVVRTAPRGTRGDVDVFTRITRPQGSPIDAVWAVRSTGAAMQVNNVTVNGINVALTQEADFTSFIQKNGFNALVDFMRRGK